MFRIMEWFNDPLPLVPKDTKGVKYSMAYKNGSIYVRFNIWRRALKCSAERIIVAYSRGGVFRQKAVKKMDTAQNAGFLFLKLEGLEDLGSLEENDIVEVEGLEIEFEGCGFVLPKGVFQKSGL